MVTILYPNVKRVLGREFGLCSVIFTWAGASPAPLPDRRQGWSDGGRWLSPGCCRGAQQRVERLPAIGAQRQMMMKERHQRGSVLAPAAAVGVRIQKGVGLIIATQTRWAPWIAAPFDDSRRQNRQAVAPQCK